MSFFRKWKLYTKHKKLSEDWGLATSLKDLSDTGDLDEDQSTTTTFNLKFLGSTPIESEKSKNATAEAIKAVISSSKSSRRKAQRVNLNVSPRGIEMMDVSTGTQILRVSIYKISYCSADAAHDHVFAFIGSPDSVDPNDAMDNATAAEKIDTSKVATSKDNDKLTCYVFLCPKRRIAHDVTLTVARCFENAYQMWRHTVERKMYTDELQSRGNKDGRKEKTDESCREEPIRDLLIDFTPEISSNFLESDHRQYLQNTWVAFDDEPKDMDRFCNASWEQPLVC